MATLYGNQYNSAYVAKPSVKIQPGDVKGQELVMFFDYTITAAPSNGDVLKLGKLPKGARVLETCLSFPDLGTAGSLNLGWAASAEKDGPQGLTGTVLEAADADGFMAAVDVATAADTVLMSGQNNMPGFLKEFSAEVDVQIDIATAWTVTSGTLKGYLKYIIV